MNVLRTISRAWHSVTRGKNSAVGTFRPEDFYGLQPRSAHAYREQFDVAENFTCAIRASVERINWIDKSVINDETPSIIEPMLMAAGITDLRQSKAQCLKWSAYLVPHVERAFGIRAILTIGQLWRENDPLFNPTWEQFHRLHEEGFSLEDFGKNGTGFNFHAWITLETGEILDFTLLSSLADAVPKKWGEMAGTVVGGYPEEVIKHHQYVPMVLGLDFAHTLNKRSPVALLAKSAHDLPKLPMFVAAVPI